MNSLKKQQGSVQIVVVTVLILAILGALGFVFWQNTNNLTSDEDSSDVDSSLSPGLTPYVAIVPDGWETYASDDLGVTYSYPASSKTTVEKLKADSLIGVGFGAPVYVKYSSAAGVWETYENDSSNQPVVRDDNLVTTISAMVEGKYLSAYYNTGDSTTGETRVLVVVGGIVYQVSFTESILDVEEIDQFIKTVTVG